VLNCTLVETELSLGNIYLPQRYFSSRVTRSNSQSSFRHKRLILLSLSIHASVSVSHGTKLTRNLEYIIRQHFKTTLVNTVYNKDLLVN